MSTTATKPAEPSKSAPTKASKARAATPPSGTGKRRPPRAFAFQYSKWGLLGALLFFSASLVPSLLPRSGPAQGIISAITAVIGYGLACGFVALWHYVRGPVPHGKARRIALLVVLGALTVLLAVSIWGYVGWQNETRELFGLDPLTPIVWVQIVIIGAVFFWLFLAIGRGFRTLFRWTANLVDRWLPRRLAVTLSSILTLLLVWGLLSGAIIDGFFAAANSTFSTRDSGDKPLVEPVTSSFVSGSPDSLVEWDELGRQGREFVFRQQKVDDINEVTGGGAVEPIRVYVGLKSADTVQGRADLLLEELKRTGAFDREAIVIASTTGTGWLDSNAMDPLEYIHNGSTAIAGVQYSYLPSWISLFADREIVKETSQVVFQTIHDYWSTLPEDSRPDLFLFGLSLGSYGAESVLTNANIMNAPLDGALMTGAPFFNPLHTNVTDHREPGTPEWNPTYGDGRTIRFTAQEDLLHRDEGIWGPNTRLVYLQHGTDGVIWFEASLLYRSPDWLKEGERAPDVSERMTWYPVITFWQVAMDLAGAGGAPTGFGHEYAVSEYTASWAALFDIPGWTDEQSEAVARYVAAKHEEFDAAAEAEG